jgi:Alpha/beta hydrolase family
VNGTGTRASEGETGLVVSADGTSIAYERMGSGPTVILVGGGLTDRSENAPLARELAHRFTVINYDRRGRGQSADVPPYAPAREIDDIDALIDASGEPAHLYGASSGGALVLEAAAAGLPIDRLAVYEVPYNTSDAWPQRWLEYVETLEILLAQGRRGDALELFMRLAESSEASIAAARTSPMWTGLEGIADTLAYDAACLGDGRPPTSRLARIARPALVATGAGARQPGAASWVLALEPAADVIAATIPRAERFTIEGQGHVADPTALARVLERFFSE